VCSLPCDAHAVKALRTALHWCACLLDAPTAVFAGYTGLRASWALHLALQQLIDTPSVRHGSWVWVCAGAQLLEPVSSVGAPSAAAPGPEEGGDAEQLDVSVSVKDSGMRLVAALSPDVRWESGAAEARALQRCWLARPCLWHVPVQATAGHAGSMKAPMCPSCGVTCRGCL